jgi:hypothetical protein
MPKVSKIIRAHCYKILDQNSVRRVSVSPRPRVVPLCLVPSVYCLVPSSYYLLPATCYLLPAALTLSFLGHNTV